MTAITTTEEALELMQHHHHSNGTPLAPTHEHHQRGTCASHHAGVSGLDLVIGIVGAAGSRDVRGEAAQAHHHLFEDDSPPRIPVPRIIDRPSVLPKLRSAASTQHNSPAVDKEQIKLNMAAVANEGDVRGNDATGGPVGGGGGDMNMSLVSPPFTPTTSQINLAGISGSLAANARTSPEPLSLNGSAQPEAAVEASAAGCARVRQSLEPQLPQVFCESRARIPTTNGEEIFLHVYRNNVDSKEHLAIVFGQDIHSKTLFAPRPGETEHDRMTRGAYTGRLYPGRETSGPESERPSDEDSADNDGAKKDVLCRIHSECYTGETAWSARCDCGEQLDEAARIMSQEGRGVIVYLRQEGRGIGLGEKLKAYNLQDLGADTVQANLMLRHPADGRTFGLATAILLDLGLDHIRLMTNNPDKIVAVSGAHNEIQVTQRVPMIPLSWQKKGGFESTEVDKYLATKIERMGHLLDPR